MIKVCFFDVDGTLYSHSSKTVPESTVSAISRLRENGVKAVVCTGRSLSDFLGLPVGKIAFDGYLTINGMLCYDSEYNCYAGTPIPTHDAEILKMIFFSEHIPLAVINESGAVINIKTDMVDTIQKESGALNPDIGMYKGNKIYQATAFVTPKHKQMLMNLLDCCDITSWHDGGVDIIAKGSGKDVGIRHYLEKYGFSIEETMAFGDGENDIRMLQYVGTGVALGNAKDSLKNVADYVTTDINDDGVARALEHYGLI